MSLNWSIENCKEDPTVLNTTDDGGWEEDGTYRASSNAVTHAIIWATLAVDLPGVRTEADVEEFVWRLTFLSRVGLYNDPLPAHDIVEEGTEGAVWSEESEVWYLPKYRRILPEDLHRRIGMTTNVSRKSRAQFVKRVVDVLKSDTDYEAKNLMREVTYQ